MKMTGLAGTVALVGAALLTIGLGNFVNAPQAAAVPAIPPTDGDLDLKSVGLKSGFVVSVPEATLDADGRSARVLIPIAEDIVVLDLVKHSVRARSFQLVAAQADGRFESVQPTPVETYRGAIANDPGSIAAISIFPDGIAGRVKSSDGREIWIEPISGKVDGARPRDHVVYEAADVAPFDGRCGVSDDAGPHIPLGGEAQSRMASGVFCTAQIAIDCDYPFFQLLGESLEALGRRVDLILNTMNVQYNTQVGIDHKLTMLLVRTNENVDPYVGNVLCDFNGGEGLEDQVKVQWADGEFPLVTRDMVHLFTGRVTGNILGCNWTAAVCGGGWDENYSFGASRIDYNGSLSTSTDLLAHELGHGWGAGHCSCWNPPYTMNSTLMTANDFNPNISIPTILAYRDAWNNCLDCDGEMTEACGSGNSTCYNESLPASPFCSDESCCIIVCAVDPFCCALEWDALCAQKGLEICAGCGTPEAGNPYEANGSPGCSDIECCEAVCGIDAYCCSTEWDNVCVEKAFANCSGCGNEKAGSPYQEHGPTSNDLECCSLICEFNLLCCQEAWDEACVLSAAGLCAGCGNEEAGSPFLNNGSPGCEDIDCCVLVCDNDPFCCETEWDYTCAFEAATRCYGWCSGDFNFDAIVDGADLGLLISNWGSKSAKLEDLNDDKIVDGADLGIFLGNWGSCDY
ncbi:MAG: M12 family metallo-peptidase [Phycisphaerales bacterium]|nr:M12 family metallo-peptidase [Phycisphaerales bacterium]